MKSGLAEQPSRPSRWDALRSDNDAPSHSSSGKGRRRQWKAPIPQNNHHNSSTSSLSSGLGSWRRRHHTNDFSSFNTRRTPRQTTEEEGAINRAIADLQNNNNNTINAEHIMTELNIALFGSSSSSSDYSTFLNDLLRSSKVEVTTKLLLPVYNISPDKQWEAAYSILQMLSSSHDSTIIQNQPTHDTKFIRCITKTASACLHLLSLQQQHNNGVGIISELRLSECITLLLDKLQLQESGQRTTTTDDDCNDRLRCNSNLFQCIAKLLAVSTIQGGRTAGKNNNNNTISREGGGGRVIGALCSWGAEKAVSRIIKDAALPFIEGLLLEEVSSSCTTDGAAAELLSDSMKLIYSHGAIECIYWLLLGTNDRELKPAIMVQPKAFQVSKHAAAMLAALVLDVMPDGKESQRVNPLRLRILRALSVCWRWSVESIHSNMNEPDIQTQTAAELEMILRCMTVTFHTMHALERGIAQKQRSGGGGGDTFEINVTSIARDIKTLLTMEKLNTFQPQILRLLTSLCLTYPVTTANQWHLFLEKTGSMQPFLLSTVEEGTVALRRKDFNDASWILLPDAMQTITSLISSIPFTNWIGHGDGRPSTKISGGNFVCRVRNSMIALITNLTKLTTTVKSIIMEGDYYSDESHVELIILQSAMLTGKLCTSLPFNDGNHIFVTPAMTLVQCAGEIFVFSARALESGRGNHILLSSSMAHFSHVIATIRNENASISVPVKHWLSDASSYDLIGILLNGSYSTLTLSSSSKCKLEILTSIAKLAPWSITREPFNLASFREICANLCNGQNDTARRLLGVKLIEAFIVGRKAYVIECSSEKLPHNMELAVVPESFCPLLHSSLRDQSSAVRTCAVTSFGSLLVTDWAELLSRGTFIGNATSLDWTHVDSILRMCNPNGEKSGSVRSAACKAVGDICKNCIGSLLSEEGLEKAVPFSDDFVVAISTKICSEMELALNDETAIVRSMALFAIGNTALAMKDRCAFLSMNRMFPLINACVVDKDDKVVGNAIRTIGHASYFIYTPEFLSNEGGSVSDNLKLYCNLLSHLTGKIRDVLCDATGETSRELTWKQRNSAKKHAWGSATTIGMLLGYSHLLSHFDDSLVESALLQLFRCIQLHAFINEKIFAYAVNALSALPASLWQYLSTKKCNVIACGLATSFNFLELPQKKLSSSYQANVQKQAKALITVANKRDFCQMFLLRESLPFSIDFFYQWLTCSGDVPASKFEQVVDAVTSQEIQQVIDVTDVQIFLSRTVQHNHLVQQDAMQSVAANDDEDEL